MPGNLVKINNSKSLEWYVGDSKMDELIAFLHEIGEQQSMELIINKIEVTLSAK